MAMFSNLLRCPAAERAICKSQLAHHQQGILAFDAQDGLGGVARLDYLAQAGEEQPHADRPEHIPLRNDGYDRSCIQHRVLTGQELNHRRDERKYRHQRYDHRNVLGVPLARLVGGITAPRLRTEKMSKTNHGDPRN